ncbi:unnamed protein product [Didymodactylos carnosus]|uniref:Uncharacterized protein n=1 Tax=Didymodactylos carnosus TaxID=1234261 RepID=A0A8S2R3A0_9BILA|nr:unnamed protein product [Didymodactylos carnosus]CAF4128979.1 unnamed protein product [Didymodactylos carnosus]
MSSAEHRQADVPQNVTNDREQLAESLKQTFEIMNKRSLYEDNQTTMHNLSAETARFLWFQLFRDVIRKLPVTQESKTELIDKLKEYYISNYRQLIRIKEFELTYGSKNAIHWYTTVSFISDIINKALRTSDIDALYSFRKKTSEREGIEQIPISGCGRASNLRKLPELKGSGRIRPGEFDLGTAEGKDERKD